MVDYYKPKWLQTKSIGLFISGGVHLLFLGLILPNLNSDRDELDLSRGPRRVRLVRITPQSPRENLKNNTNLTPSTSLVNPNPVIENPLLSSPDNLNLEDTQVSPELPIPEPPPLSSLDSSLNRDRTSSPFLDFSPPAPLPPELLNIINPTEDSLNSPKLIKPEIPVETATKTTESPSTTPPETDTANSDDLIASYEAKAKALKYDSTNTSEKEVKDNYNRWIRWQSGTNPIKINWQGKYPLDACIKRLEGKAVYGVLVSPDGSIINLHLIQSTGYSLLNQIASEEIEAYQFSPSEEIQGYLTTVEFKFASDICPSLTIPSR